MQHFRSLPGNKGMCPSNVVLRNFYLTSLSSLPLDVIMIVTSELYPKIQGLKSSLSGPTANTAIVDLLRNAALQEHLPKLGSLNPRRFAVSLCGALNRAIH